MICQLRVGCTVEYLVQDVAFADFPLLEQAQCGVRVVRCFEGGVPG